MSQQKNLKQNCKNMKNKKLTVTIGIPAYNEEKNITHLLSSLLTQKETFYKIKSIFVISDASTDNTVGVVKKLGDRRIIVVQNSIRKGQIHAQNLIFTYAKTDVVIILEADTIPDDKKYLHHLLSPIALDPSIGLVGGNSIPLLPQKLLGKIIYFQIQTYKEVDDDYAGPKYWHFSGRGGRAFTKAIYKNLDWPYDTQEDIYAILWCLKHKIKNTFARNAVCNYRVPETFRDFLRERQKIKSGRITLKEYFSTEFLNYFYNRPISFKILSFTKYLISHPAYCLIYLFLKLRIAVNLSSSEFTDLWPITSSTKTLYKYEK